MKRSSCSTQPLTIQDLTALRCIYESSNSLIYLQDTNSYGQPVVIKLLKPNSAAPREIDRFANEYNLTKSLSIPGIRCAYDSIIVDGRPALILEYVEGKTLQQAFVEERPLLADILKVAISITQALNDLHRQHIVHRNLSSANILIKHHQQTATLIDFGLATPVDPRTGHVEIPAVLEGSLPYISPEQTGRVNRFVDYRTDLYSLGVVLYELLTGKLPFDAASAPELVHCHLAKTPKPVYEINPDIPPVISEIVMKLMAKNAEDRYQSTYGLKVDLENCLNQLTTRGVIEAFELAREDASWIFQVPQKLCGREEELQTLLEAVDRVTLGMGKILLVVGHAGVGKSSLVGDIRRRVMEKGGHFITGRHDEYHQNTPYYALIQAFTEMVDLMLMESAEQLAHWKTRITQALGANGGLLIEVIPRLELIIGRQPPVAALDPPEAQHRFHHVFRGFIRAIAQKQHPLVMFIDNLQWADIASLELLKLLMTGVKHQQWLFIGAYRNNEVGPTSPLMAMVKALEQFKTPIKMIHLENLSRDALNLLVADTLKCAPVYAQPLADLIAEKTGGNPLLAVQFLQALYEEGLLAFNFDTQQWVVWDTEQIRTVDLTTNVATLMTQKIERFSEKTRKLLSLAACMGSSFKLEELAAIAGQSTPQTFDQLGKVLEEGLILPVAQNYPPPASEADRPIGLGNRFEFLHDRIRQAAYALLSKKYKKSVHLSIGRLRLQATPETELEEHIFDLTDHFNQGFQYLKDEQEKLRVINLNLLAGRKAKRAAAYQAAIWYLEMGLGMLPPDKWERHYSLTLNLYMEAVEAEYLSTNFGRADLLSTEALLHVQDLLTKIKIYELRILFYSAQNQNSPAIKAGLEALDLLDVYLPIDPRKIKAYTEELRRDLAQEIGRIDDLAHLPVMLDTYQLAAMRILMDLAAPAYQANSALLTVIIFKMVLMSIKYGNSPPAAFAYGWYAVLLCGMYGDIEKGYRFGQLSLKVIRQFQPTELEARILFLFNIFVRPWQEHAGETIRPLQEVYQRGLETGDLEYTYSGAIHYCSYLFCTGGSLEYIRQQQAEYLEAIERSRLEFHSSFGRIWGQTVLNLLSGSGETNIDPGRLSGNLLDESKMLPLWIKRNEQVLVFCALCCRTMLQYLFGNYAGAVESARLGEAYEKGGVGYIYLAEHNFYYALALLAHYPQAAPQAQKEYLKKVAALQRKMKWWADHAPMNFKHKHDLIEAERARIVGGTLKAMGSFGQAIKGAKENGYVHEEALAHEREAEFYIALGRDDFAGLCLRKAGDGYRLWGATRKVEDLEKRYRHLLVKDRVTSLDTAAIIKASHMLSQEIRLEQLLDKMMHLVIENAGAEKGILIEHKNNKLVVQAKGAIELSQVKTMQDTPIAESGEVPVSVVNYVARTLAPVVLSNAFYDSVYAADKYIAEHQVRSLLCLPIIHQAKLSGLLYLENNLATNVFTPDRLELLQALVSQAAISMENARLYADLEKNISELKEAEEALRLTQFAVDRAGDGAVLVDSAARLLYVNEAVYRSMGYSREEMLSMAVYDFDLNYPPKIWADHWEELKRHGSLTLETRHHRKDGTIFPVEVTANYIEIAGRAYNFAFVRDITERKKAEVERETLIAELEAKNAELERFTYTVSHDLKSPLVTIQGFLGYLERDAFAGNTERIKEDITRIVNAADKMQQLLADLLELSRIGRLMNQPEEMPLGDLVHEALSVVAGQLVERGVRVTIAPDLPQVYGDRVRLREVLQNLVDNAVKFMGDQPHPHIEIGMLPQEANAEQVFYVRDNGVGIDSRYHDRVFGLFERLDQKTEGTGIGLTIVKRIVEVYGGRIWVESEGSGKGSTFCFTLPPR